MSKLLTHCVVGAFLLLSAGAHQSAAHCPPPVLNPRTYTSPSGEYVLSVDPSTMYGQGEGQYRLTRAGSEVWAKSLPFTLWEAAVTDEGVVAGYAYSNGVHGFPPPEERAETNREDWNGEFHVVIIDPAGNLRLNDHEKRAHSRFVDDDLAYPAAEGLVLDADHDRFVVRMTDPDLNQGVETWRVYRLSDGQRTGTFEPAKWMTQKATKDHYERWSIDGAQLVPGTPLALVHWYVAKWPEDSHDACFTLIDPEGRPVWRLDRPGEYRVKDDDRATRAFEDYLREHGAILDASRPRQFELWFPSQAARATFEVEPDPTNAQALQVTETGRQPHVGFDVIKPQEPTIESIELERLGTVSLLGATAAPSAIRQVADFGFDDQGRIGLIRFERQGTGAFVLAQPTGEIVCEVPLRDSEGKGLPHAHLAWLAGDRWVLVYSEYGVDAKARAWVLDVGTESLTELTGFDCPHAEAIASMGEKGFVILARHYYENTISDKLVAYDATGKRRWSLRSADAPPWVLSSPQDVAVTSEGIVAVVDDIGNEIDLFSKKGKYLRTIDLEKAFGKKPNYPTDITADGAGGLIVHDFGGRPPIWQVASDGTASARFNPRFADGRAFNFRGRVVGAPDGRLWAADGPSLCRMTDDGLVDRVLGEQLETEQLSEIVAFTVDARGRYYAVSNRTGTVHVFNPDGSLHHLCKPLPTDFASSILDAEVTVAGDGSVFVGKGSCGRAKRYLQFSPDGQRVGLSTLDSDDIKADWHFKPNSNERWIETMYEVYLVGEDGQPIQTVKRLPNRNWLESVRCLGIALDGGLAVLCSDSEQWFNREKDPMIGIYGPQGEPIRTIALPFDCGAWEMAYNGEFVVLAWDADLLIVAADGSSIRRFTPQSTAEKPYWQPFFSPDGKELLVFDKEAGTVQRYAAPHPASATP